jgi:DDE domain
MNAVRQAKIDQHSLELARRRMSDNTRLSGTAAKQLAGARQHDGRQSSGRAVNHNFSARAICNAVMHNGDVIERTAPELIRLHRSDVANICEAAPTRGPDRIYRFDAVAGKAPTYTAARAELTKEGRYPKDTQHRQVKYLNNVVESDHGKLKQPIRLVRGFKTLRTADATIKGFEVMRALRRGRAAIFTSSAIFTVRRASSSAPTALVLSQ